MAAVALIIMVIPGASSGSELESVFVTSTSGTSVINVGDTIQFEVIVTTNADQVYDTILWSLTGDAVVAVGSTIESGWAGVSQMATNWEWIYTPRNSGLVKISTTGRFSLNALAEGTSSILPLPDRVAGNNGFIATHKTGTGNPSIVGTVTITADTPGIYQGGAFLLPGVDGFMSMGSADTVSVFTAEFTVGPINSGPALSGWGVVLVAGSLLAAIVRFSRREVSTLEERRDDD